MRLVHGVAATALTLGVAGGATGYEPRVNYALHCMGCHHADGAGDDGRVPSIRHTLVHFSASPEGRNFVMRVPGVAQAPLSDAEIAALLNWMARNLSDMSVPDGFVNYTADEVARERHRPLIDVRAARERLLAGAAE